MSTSQDRPRMIIRCHKQAHILKTILIKYVYENPFPTQICKINPYTHTNQYSHTQTRNFFFRRPRPLSIAPVKRKQRKNQTYVARARTFRPFPLIYRYQIKKLSKGSLSLEPGVDQNTALHIPLVACDFAFLISASLSWFTQLHFSAKSSLLALI